MRQVLWLKKSFWILGIQFPTIVLEIHKYRLGQLQKSLLGYAIPYFNTRNRNCDNN